jgi:hypothetical protein
LREKSMSGTRAIAVLFVTTAMLITGGADRARAALVSQWLFNETGGSIAHDSVGGINGTLYGGATFDPGAGPGGGIYSGAISLNAATDSYVDMGNVYPFTSGSFSIEAWIKLTPGNTTFYPNVVGKQEGGVVSGYGLFTSAPYLAGTAGKAGFYASDGAPSGYAYSTTSVNDGAWYQVVGVYNANGTHQIYVDGTLQGSTSSSPILANTADFLIGGFFANGVNSGDFTGLISDVSVYNNALSASDVYSSYEQVINSQSVPEPSSLVMGSLALACVGGAIALKRRRRS